MDLCLAFALFKLLRARFQNFQVEEEVAVKNRDLIFRGLSNNDDAGGQGVDDSTNGDDRDGDDSSSKQLAERAFQVIELELNFVMDYYHSVVPVVLCSPWFLVGNYFFVFLIVVNQAVIALVITGNGALLPVIGCLARDVVTLSRRAIVLFKCLGHKVLQTTIDLFSSFNILVSLLLFLTFPCHGGVGVRGVRALRLAPGVPAVRVRTGPGGSPHGGCREPSARCCG